MTSKSPLILSDKTSIGSLIKDVLWNEGVSVCNLLIINRSVVNTVVKN